MEQMKLNKEQMVEMITNTLKQHVCKVTFTKVNGELREMTCTLKADIVPAYERKTPVKEDTEKVRDTISVWDLDKKAWRSFRLDNIQGIQVGASA